ncbi:3D domain-containing protein [Biformimicrobium ophioploci]|nr:hypothetical protein [Microbulbifer sp. NKW57]
MKKLAKNLAFLMLSGFIGMTAPTAFAGIETKAGEKKRKRVVTATAYNSVPGQTDDTPWLAAWNNKLKPGQKIIAVSRDLEKLGLTNGAKVEIEGLGVFTVRDRMNKRWRNKIDIWMESDVKAARKFGAKKLKILW